MSFVPHTDVEIKTMLSAIGVDNIDALFSEIPAELRYSGLKNIPEAVSELVLQQQMQKVARQDEVDLCFIGAGAYEHFIPAAVWELVGRGEFMTAYTPYQAEASQGGLQLLYEFQTMMAALTGMDVANASVYDGAGSLAEAILMAARIQRKAKQQRILLPTTVHPYYRAAARTLIANQNIEIVELPYNKQSGLTSIDKFDEPFTALVIQQPNFFGALEEVDVLVNWAHDRGAQVIGCVNPISLGLIKSPGQWGTLGADIVCGEGQSLGVPLASGGPYFGFMTTRKSLVRELPGRIVGRTLDEQGNSGFTLTLQAREQHIRRAKAKSNICTNQGLLVTAATIYMSLMGPTGIYNTALRSHQNFSALCQQLKTIGVDLAFDSAHFHEGVFKLPISAAKVIAELAAKNIQAGFDLAQVYPELENHLHICVTETKTSEQISAFVQQLKQVL